MSGLPDALQLINLRCVLRGKRRLKLRCETGGSYGVQNISMWY